MMEVILLATCFTTLLIATAYDLKWRYVPDYASYSFITIAIIERILYAIELGELNALLWVIPAATILTGFGYLLYKGGLWGGGDVKIIASTAILLAWFPTEVIPLFMDFFMNLMIIGALYILPTAIIIGLKNNIKPTRKEKILIILGIVTGLIIYSNQPTLMNGIVFIGIIVVTSITYLKRIEEKGFIKPANMKTLMDGDWLVEEVKVGRKKIVPKNEGLTKEEASQIKKWWAQGKLKKKPLIKEGVAYLPAFLLTFIVTLAFGNLMILVVAEGMGNAPEIIRFLQ